MLRTRAIASGLALVAFGCASTDSGSEPAIDSNVADSADAIVLDVATDATKDGDADGALESGKDADAKPLFDTDTICGDGILDGTEKCDDGNTVDGDGCSADCHIEGCATADVRIGIADWKTYPNIAICGPAVDYPTARDATPSVCGKGFHECAFLVDDITTIFSGKPKPPDIPVAWLKFDDSACNVQSISLDTACAGTVVGNAFFLGTGGCTSTGMCTEGYRPAVSDSMWGWGLRSGGGPCTAHVGYVCGFAGGTVPVTASHTLCCRG